MRFDVGKGGAEEEFPALAFLSGWLEALPEMGSREGIWVLEQ